jgi:hypothetical protein
MHQSTARGNTGRGRPGGRVLVRVRVITLAFSVLRRPLTPAAAELKGLHDEPCHRQEHLESQRQRSRRLWRRRARAREHASTREGSRWAPCGPASPSGLPSRPAPRRHQGGTKARPAMGGVRPCWCTVSNVPPTRVWGRSAHCFSSTCPTESPRHARYSLSDCSRPEWEDKESPLGTCPSCVELAARLARLRWQATAAALISGPCGRAATAAFTCGGSHVHPCPCPCPCACGLWPLLPPGTKQLRCSGQCA